jgi:prepilin-type N-terminal cleavage/methylation domain-containing protein
MTKLLNNQKGFTLIELAIGMAIMTIIMAGVLSIMSTSIKSYQYSQKRVYEAQQARAAINAVLDDLRLARTVAIENEGTVTYTTLRDDGVTVDSSTIRIENGRLMKNTTAVTANIINSISFVREDASNLRIIRVTATLRSPDNNSSGNFVIDTVVFATNLAI